MLHDRATAVERSAYVDKFLVESKDICSLAIQNEALLPDKMAMPNAAWTKICSPPADAGLVSIILYDQDADRSKLVDRDIVTIPLLCIVYLTNSISIR